MDPRVRARIHWRRQFAARGLGEVFDALREILYQADPLNPGVGGQNRDEYGSPVSTIIPRLESFTDAAQAKFAVEDEFRKHYPREQFVGVDWNAIGVSCWNAWRKSGESRRG